MAATVEHWPLKELVAPRTVIDVGANKGQFTLFALEAWPGCRVLAFEPLPGPAARFRKALGGCPGVRLFEHAIGPRAGEATIHVSAREDSSSLLPIGARMEAVFPGTGELATRQIRTAPLDHDLRPEDIDPPALLKLDVQGFELEALRGCEPCLRQVAHVYVECSYLELYRGQALIGEVTGFLEQRGFRLAAELNLVMQNGVGRVQSDCLFGRAA